MPNFFQVLFLFVLVIIFYPKSARKLSESPARRSPRSSSQGSRSQRANASSESRAQSQPKSQKKPRKRPSKRKRGDRNDPPADATQVLPEDPDATQIIPQHPEQQDAEEQRIESAEASAELQEGRGLGEVLAEQLKDLVEDEVEIDTSVYLAGDSGIPSSLEIESAQVSENTSYGGVIAYILNRNQMILQTPSTMKYQAAPSTM